MPGTDYLPHREAEFVAWSIAFGQKLATSGSLFGVDAAHIAEYEDRQAEYAEAYRVGTAPGTRTTVTIAAKHAVRKRLTALARTLARVIQAHPAVTDKDRLDFGLSLRGDEPSPVKRLTQPPRLTVESGRGGRRITLRLRDAERPSRRGKPMQALGATVFYFVGDELPGDLNGWSFAGNTTNTRLSFDLPASIPGGTRVYLTAIWFDSRGRSSPAPDPVSTRAGDGVTKAA